MNKKIAVILISIYILLCGNNVIGQEINANVMVLSQQVTNSVNKNMFETLKTQLQNFINNRKWTNDSYLTTEKINCNFQLNVTSATVDGVCKATLTVQAARRIYNSDYQSPLINYQDQNIDFRYAQYQNINFNPSIPFGSDAASNNLTAIIAFYIYYILGLNYDSQLLNGGNAYFRLANNIVTAAPSTKDISGWTSFDGSRNRYWLSENTINPRYTDIGKVIYTYYRKGMDDLYTNKSEAQKNILEALTTLQNMNKENPNSMFVQQFVLGKYSEFTGIFSNADPSAKANAKSILMLVDPANANKYDGGLK